MKLFAVETGVEVIAVRKPAFVDNSMLKAMKDAVLQPDCTADLAATKDGNSVGALQNCDPFKEVSNKRRMPGRSLRTLRNVTR